MSYSVPDKETLGSVWEAVKNRSIPLKSITQAEYDVLDATQKYADICYLVSANAHITEPVEPGAPSSMKLIYKNEVLMNSDNGDATRSSFPSGAIVIWSGSSDNIPDGWALCNGENGTPDLRGRFILGTSEDHAIGETGGEEEVTLTVSQLPQHNHWTTSMGTILTNDTTLGNEFGDVKYNSTSSQKNVKLATPKATGSNLPHSNMPPYYVLAYIMKLYGAGSDIGESSSQDTGENYSTEEVRIGTWVDGKPLYRKVIESVTPSSTTQVMDIAQFATTAQLINLFGVVFSGSYRIPVPTRYGSNYIGIIAHSNIIGCSTNWQTCVDKKIFIIGEYTKTTD